MEGELLAMGHMEELGERERRSMVAMGGRGWPRTAAHSGKWARDPFRVLVVEGGGGLLHRGWLRWRMMAGGRGARRGSGGAIGRRTAALRAQARSGCVLPKWRKGEREGEKSAWMDSPA